MNFNEFNELRVKGIEVIADFIADNINNTSTNPDGSVNLSGIQSQIDSLKEADTKAARIEALQALQAALDGNAAADATLKQQVDALAASLGDVSSTQLKASVDKLLADVAAAELAADTAKTTVEQQAAAAAAAKTAADEAKATAQQQAAAAVEAKQAAAAAAATATAAVEAAKVEAARLEALARNLEQGGAGNSDDYEF